MPNISAQRPVIVAGAGPVGLIVALVLGRAGIPVKLFDEGNIVISHPRAATIHPATLDILDDLGIYKLIEPQGVICPIVNYYDGKNLLASFDHRILKDEVRYPWVLQCEQDKLARTTYELVRKLPSVEVHTESKVVACSQSADGVEVTVEHDGKQQRHQGVYLVGADGARSTIRKQIGVAFEGFTYPERFTIIGTPHDFETDGFAYRNYVSDPEEWYNLFKISWTGPPGVYRLVCPVRPDEAYDNDAEARETAQRKLQRFCPQSRPYEIVIWDSYVVSQRVAETFRKGRVLLVGDSAHLNSPIGAMGMNSGIHDAVNLAANMLRVLRGEEDENALDRYERQRRHVATEHVQTATIANKAMMEQKDAATRDKYRDDMRRRAGDEKLAKAFLMKTSLIDSLRDAAQIQ